MRVPIMARTVVLIFTLILCNAGLARASQYMAEDTGKECAYCHTGAPQDLTFTPAGEAFIKNYYKLPAAGGVSAESLKTPLVKKARRLLLALHGVAGVALLGALIFIALAHPFRVEEEGLPADARKFIWLSLAVAGIAGGALVPFALSSGFAWNSVFGVLLGAKIALFAALALVVAMALFTAGKTTSARARVEEELKDPAKFAFFSPADLKMFAGRAGRKALVAFKGKVYDVSALPLWSHGLHQNKHAAGQDLTDAFPMAPHGENILQRATAVGTYDPQAKRSGLPSLNELRALAEQHYGLMKTSAALAVGISALVAIWRQM